MGENAGLTVLLTGFSAFPGTRANPTQALAEALRLRKARFARCGIRLETRVLPVVYAAIAPAIAKHVAALEPDVILHFGVATRRPHICVETRARNRVSTVYCDAAGRQAAMATIIPSGPSFAKVRLPAAEIAAAVRHSGCACVLSHNAGTYLCNAAFYLSLARPEATSVGFIHVPRLRSPHSRRPSAAALTMPKLLRAAEAVVWRAAVAARRQRPPSRSPARAMLEMGAALA
jgi:pyroglutamyl-peptidase